MVSKSIFLLIFINCLFLSCSYDAKEIIDKTSKTLPNGKHLVVEKINKETTAVGILTKYNYGTSHSFTYKFSINPESINWNGGSGEPKSILFCNDTIYIRYLKKKSIKVPYIDSINNKIKYKYHSEIHEAFQKHIDNRYFFNLLGNDYWINVSLENDTSCDKFLVPNDNELSLNEPPLKTSLKK